MNAVKKTLLVLVLTAVVAGPIAAQGPPPPGPGGPPNGAGPQAGPPPDRVLVDVLGFTETQLAQFRQVADVKRAIGDSSRYWNLTEGQIGVPAGKKEHFGYYLRGYLRIQLDGL